ncbi:hypothetical protein DRE_02148 [Drechslerella stenobrocha 248]|uniref:Nucleoporin Nup120/160-domain-containing protein n=1 Tax=Drechslerella stenobrocha 248 TaxID=1043628 RepID=W7HXY6_9PEZI|nr:hypothetical protein DRE_02148 [Drechslerella stenobrocha 248]
MVYVYKETRVSLDWASEDRIVEAIVPDYDADEDAASTAEQPEPTTNGDLIKGGTDDFPHASLATSSSVLFRAIHQTPRTILWRVIGYGKTLVLMPLDVARPRDEHGTIASAYHIRFSRRIVPGCVTFYDLPETHTLVAFVLTAGNRLYTFQLRQSFFTATDEETRLPDGWCNVFQPVSLAVRSPHFLKAVSGDSLLVALQDGSMIRLDRLIQPRSVEFGYKEMSFSDGGYFSSIKNIVRWSGAQVRYGERSIAAATVVSAAVAYRYSLLFTVSINHQLRVWSMERGTVLGTYDLLNEPASSAPSIKNFLDPAPAHLVTVIENFPQTDYMFLLLTLSPAGSGTFKLWAGTDDDTAGFTRLIDLCPNDVLKLDPPTFNSLWVVADFGIAAFSPDDPNLVSMWLLWKSNTSSRMQTVTFKLDSMPTTFGNWVDASQEQLLVQKPRSPVGGELDELSSYWLDWIFQPGRFSDSVIDRAVEIFKKNFIAQGGKSADLEQPSSNDSRHSLVLIAVQAVVSLSKKQQQEEPNSEDAVWRDFDAQWSIFYKICTELDRSRIEGLSLSVDPASGLAFVANADTVTVVRKSSESESVSQNLATATTADLQLLYRNTPNPEKSIFSSNLVESVRSLILAARELKESLSPAAFEECVSALQDEVTRPLEADVFERIDAIYDRCFEGRLPQSHLDQVASIVAALRHSPEQTFRTVLHSIRHCERFGGSSRLTVFGEKLLLRGSQEVVHVNYSLLFELTLLLVLVHSSAVVEIEDIEPYNVLYLDLISLLREYNILAWLSKNSWTPTAEDVETEGNLRRTLGSIRRHHQHSLPQIHNFPVLQILLDEEGGPPPSIVGSGPTTLTSSIQRFLAATDLGNFSSAITLIASRLLRMNAIRLMGEFMPYLPSSPWGDYLKARMAVCRKEWKLAEELFKSSAPGIAAPHQPPVSSMDALFTPIELEYLCAGLSKFYFHVAEIFEHRKQYDEVVVFSELAYQALPPHLDEEGVLLRSDILARQFSAGLQVPNYGSSYSALISYSDKALQRQGLRSLIISMCEHHQAEAMCEFEFPGLHEAVDGVLEHQYEQIREVAAGGVPYHKIAYAWRMLKGNRRGAASVLYDQLKKLQGCLTNTQRYSGKEVRDAYLGLLNVLSLVPKEQAYVFTRLHAEQESSGVHFVDGMKLKRRVVTVDNIREEYQEEVRKTIEYLSGGVFF